MRSKGYLMATLGLIVSSCHEPHPVRTATNPSVSAEIRRSIRVVYPFSLIPGGIQSGEELERARAADRLLDTHYGEVGLLRPAVLTRDKWQYASYRRGDRIFWTARRIRVAAGESVFTDRDGNQVRGRCGNRLSETPREPIEFTPPPDLDTPQTDFEIAWLDAPQPLPLLPLVPPVFDALPPLSQYPRPLTATRTDSRFFPEETGGRLPVLTRSSPAASRFQPFARSLATPEPGLSFPLLALLFVLGWRVRATSERTD